MPDAARLESFRALHAAERDAARARVRVLVLTGLGLNCEAETEAAFRMAGAVPERVHLLDLLEGRAPHPLSDYAILAFIGGFAFGDHLGAGFVFANKIRWRLYDALLGFVARGGLAAALARTAMAGELGLEAGLDAVTEGTVADDALLFAETPGLVVASVSPADRDRFRELLAGHPFAEVGRVTSEPRLVLRRGGRALVDVAVGDLKAAWKEAPVHA